MGLTGECAKIQYRQANVTPGKNRIIKTTRTITLAGLATLLLSINGFSARPAGVQQLDKPDLIQTFLAGTNPTFLAFDGENVWATNNTVGTVTKLRASDGALLGTFAVGVEPQLITFDGANIWVANTFGNNVTELRASDGTVLHTFPVGSVPEVSHGTAPTSGSVITLIIP